MAFMQPPGTMPGVPVYSTPQATPAAAMGGALPWGRSPGIGNPSDPASIAQAYTSAYNNALDMNQANYNNILAGYQSSLTQQTTAQQAIQSGYTDLYNSVLAQIKDYGQSRADAINADSAKQLGGLSQQMIDRGLGNTTIQQSLARGVEADRNAAQLSLSDSLARQNAEYMSRLGLAGLDNRSRGLDAEMAWRGRQLDFQNSVTARYPDAGVYANLAASAARESARSSGGGAFAGGSVGGIPAGPQIGRLGYTGYQEPYYGSSGQGGAAGYGAAASAGGGYGNIAGGIGSVISPGQDFSGGYTVPGGGYSPEVPRGWDQPPATGDAGAGLGDPYAWSPVDANALVGAASGYASALSDVFSPW